jgi:O-antigen/teichoic acid export membrane protein
MAIKLIGKATLLYSVGNVCLRAASFLLIPLYAHFLSIEDYGLLMTLLLTVQFMLAIMNCGMEHALVRFADEYDRKKLLGGLIGTSCLINAAAGAVLTAAVLTLLAPFFRSILHVRQVHTLMALTCAVSLLQSLCDHIVAYYRAMNQPLRYTVAGVCSAAILIGASFVFIYVLDMGVKGALLAKIITHFLILAAVGRHILSAKGFGISSNMAPRLLHFGLPLAFSSFGQYAVSGAGIYFLGLFSGLGAVAIFATGHKLATAMLTVLILPFQLSFQPFVFSKLGAPDLKSQMSRLLTYLLLAVSAGSFTVIAAAKLLLPVIAPPEYACAYTVTVLMMPAMGCLGIFYYGETLLKAAQKSYIIALVVAICAAFAVTANYLLVSLFSWYGAVAASNITFILLAGTSLTIGLKEFPVPLERRRIGIAAAVFAAVMLFNLLLLGTDRLTYCLLCVLFAAAAAWLLAACSFLDGREKDFLRQLTAKRKRGGQRNPGPRTQEKADFSSH